MPLLTGFIIITQTACLALYERISSWSRKGAGQARGSSELSWGGLLGASEMLPGLLIGEVLETVENISVQTSKQIAGQLTDNTTCQLLAWFLCLLSILYSVCMVGVGTFSGHKRRQRLGWVWGTEAELWRFSHYPSPWTMFFSYPALLDSTQPFPRRTQSEEGAGAARGSLSGYLPGYKDGKGKAAVIQVPQPHRVASSYGGRQTASSSLVEALLVVYPVGFPIP